VGASFITGAGNAGATIAAAFAVIDSGGDATDVGLVAAARTVAMVVLLLVGGAVADRLPRQRVMAVANVVNAFSQALFAGLVLTGHAALWQMALLTAVGGGAHAFFAPAAQGLVLATVEAAHAGPAISVYRLATNAAVVGGAALGGALVAAVGAGWVLAADAAGFAVAAVLRSRIDTANADRVPASGGVLGDLRAGWREVVSRPWLWGIVVQFSVVNGMLTVVESVYGPLVSRDHLGGAGPWGLALAAGGLGTACGAVLMVRWKPRRALFVGTLCVFPLALPGAALALLLPAWTLALVMFTGGLAIEVFAVGWMLAMHQEIPDDLMSRVAAYDWLGSVAMTPLAVALAGPASSAFGLTASLWASSALVALLTAAVLALPDVRRLELAPPKDGERAARDAGGAAEVGQGAAA
jgi:predicted MFS family arabinose efflux permease